MTRLPHRSLLVLAIALLAQGVLLPQGFDHSRWDKILKANVTEEGWVGYQAIQEKWTAELKAYIGELGDASLKSLTTDKEKMAFWINAYNAVCIQKLLDHGLPAKVPHAVLFGKNIFTETTYRIAGEVRSLDNIEHDILRKQFKDNRIHAALVCGASSCPRLRPEAYTGEALDKQLDEECRRWVRTGKTKKGDRKNYLNRNKNTFEVSKIFSWFEEDFGGNKQGVLEFLKQFASESDRQYLKTHRVGIRYLDYDWSLNSKPLKSDRPSR